MAETTIFNPNELILEKVRTVEEYDAGTKSLTGRYTQIEDPSLSTSADGTDVTDAMGNSIATFYQNQQGTFSFTNSLFSLDLAASQFGTTKNVASGTNKIEVPVSETLDIVTGETTGTVTLSYEPVGVIGKKVEFVKVINANNTFGTTYKEAVSADADEKTFTVAEKTITLPAGVTGKVFVNYVRESEKAVSVVKNTENVPSVKKLLIHAIFHDPCDVNTKYAGVILCERAQIDPSSVELNLTMEGKHAASYKLQKPYCQEDAALFTILISEQ